MAKFRVVFNNSETEDVEASRYTDIKSWVVFIQDRDEDDLLGGAKEILRLKAAHIRRIERLSD